MDSPAKSLKYLQEVEQLAEEIIRDRHEIVALDSRRQEVREGLRQLKKSEDKKIWFTLGSLLVKLPMKTAEKVLLKDQVHLDVEINKLRYQLKVKVNNLRDLEHQPPVPGLMLKSMSSEEMKAVKIVMERRST